MRLNPLAFMKQPRFARRGGAWWVGVLQGVILTFGCWVAILPANPAFAQDSRPVSTNPTTGSVTSAQVVKPSSAVSAPAWKDLTPVQQAALAPLSKHWGSLNSERKRKWLAMSQNFQAMAPEEQVKLHSRMTEWVSLSQKERTQARLNFNETRQLSAEEKAQQWQAYQALSPEEKKELAAKAPPKPTGVAVTKPAQHTKLADVPVTRLSPVPGSKLAVAKQPVQQNTLLPRPPSSETSGDKP